MERSELYGYLQGNRAVATVCALVLLAVPTAATLFPGVVERTDRGRRILIMVLWLLAAPLLRWPVKPTTGRRPAARRPGPFPAGGRRQSASHPGRRPACRARPADLRDPHLLCGDLSMADSRHRLVPWFPVGVQDPADPRVLDQGQGVTGSAYADRRMTCAVGEGVIHETLGLTPAQRQLFAPYRIVVAVPVQRVDGAVVGALTVMAADNDGTFVSTDGQGEVMAAGQALLEELAGKIGVALAGATELDMT